ncbi:putative late blight resistance protein homolog R1A-10 [Salvia splendens]|uniref:putative late blight resistance protein homolog R1A-10 n=1 Tax=Salvia splendens TaxID=180675 RepID=UPI001C276291|nr:putative late blight resistance protein homolog R1A-10 [Salvia splendens]
MAYAAVNSLLKILDELQDPDQLQVIQYPTEHVEHLRQTLHFFQEFLEVNFSSGGDLEVKIREALYKAEDIFDSNISKYVLNSKKAYWKEENYMSSFSLALEGVITEVDSLTKTVIASTMKPSELPDSSAPDVSERSLTVGREAVLIDLTDRLVAGSDALGTVPILGISGIGKTHLARVIYDDPNIVCRFRLRGWVKVSQEYSKKEILLGALRSMAEIASQESSEDELARRLSRIFRSGNYLIVLDDVCNPKDWSNLKELFPDYHNGSRVMLTTRRKEVAESASNGGLCVEIFPLDNEESWSLFQSVVFRNKSCPKELEGTARRVCANCKGLPSAIITVGGVLMEAGSDDWEFAASSLSGCGDIDELVDAVMLLNYMTLPQYMKSCILYMGIFPNNHEIHVPKLFELWIDEEFIEKSGQSQSLEKMAEKCLLQLVERGFVLVSEQNSVGKIITCRIDGFYDEFLKKKADEEKFFHFLPTSLISQLSPRKLTVGRDDVIRHLTNRLMARSDALALEAVPIFGICGVGKTHLARIVYDDPDIVQRFRWRAWVKVPLEYSKKEILLGLLHSMGKLASGKGQESTEDELAKRLLTILKSDSYLIWLDDVCNPEAWDNLNVLFPDCNNGSRVLITTRGREVAVSAGRPIPEICLLSEKESLSLLHQQVFHYKPCPKELRETARSVSGKCRGLPLAIVTVGEVLVEAGQEDWEIAESSLSNCDKPNDLIDAVMLLSYKSLPEYAKACLLYMGIFSNNHEIVVSKLFKLWIAEGFIEKDDRFESLDGMAEKCLWQLVKRRIILVSERSPIGKIRTCRVDGVYGEFLKKKANKEEFFHIISEYTSHFPRETLNQGRFCIIKNIHFSNKDELQSEKVRSLLFGGVQEQYSLWLHLHFKFLKVLDALKIRFYSFPDEIPELVHLRYLALTYDGEIPEKICRLRNLQFLIVLQYVCSKISNAVSRLPEKIWDLNQLRHLQLMGRDLPDPSTSTPCLENLVTLLGVSSHSCTPEILQRVPNLKKFGVLIESPALDAAEDFSSLCHLVTLQHLVSFKFLVMHPDFESQVVHVNPSFPTTLTKLSLSGCGLSWENMKVIATLPMLESLKLRWHSFQGSEWKQDRDGDGQKYFPQLKYLLLEDLDMERWRTNRGHFSMLTNLVVRHCYKLQEIPIEICYITTLKKIELVDCSSSAVESVQRIKDKQPTKGSIQVNTHSSRDD